MAHGPLYRLSVAVEALAAVGGTDDHDDARASAFRAKSSTQAARLFLVDGQTVRAAVQLGEAMAELRAAQKVSTVQPNQARFDRAACEIRAAAKAIRRARVRGRR